MRCSYLLASEEGTKRKAANIFKICKRWYLFPLLPPPPQQVTSLALAAWNYFHNIYKILFFRCTLQMIWNLAHTYKLIAPYVFGENKLLYDSIRPFFPKSFSDSQKPLFISQFWGEQTEFQSMGRNIKHTTISLLKASREEYNTWKENCVITVIGYVQVGTGHLETTWAGFP